MRRGGDPDRHPTGIQVGMTVSATSHMGRSERKKAEKKLKMVTVTVSIWAKAPFFHSGQNCKSMQKQ